jgi:hypothetical protein
MITRTGSIFVRGERGLYLGNHVTDDKPEVGRIRGDNRVFTPRSEGDDESI